MYFKTKRRNYSGGIYKSFLTTAKGKDIYIFLPNLKKSFKVRYCIKSIYCKKKKDWVNSETGFYFYLFGKYQRIWGQGVQNDEILFTEENLEIEGFDRDKVRKIFKENFSRYHKEKYAEQ